MNGNGQARSMSGPASGAPETETTRERILDVAERLFAQKGFAGTVVRDIARDTGLTAPSLYNHFDGNENDSGDDMENL